MLLYLYVGDIDMQIILGLLAIVALIFLFFLSLIVAKWCMKTFIASVVSLIKMFEMLFICFAAFIVVSGLFMTYFYKDGFPYYWLLGVAAGLAVGAFFFNFCFKVNYGVFSVIANLILSVAMGVFVATGIRELLEKKYTPVPVWMYILDYGGSIIVCSILYLYSSGFDFRDSENGLV